MSAVNNERVKRYIDEVCGLVKNKRVHNNITNELECHIEDIVEDYMSQGKSEEEATEKALIQMGSSKEVGENLNKVHKATVDWALLSMTTALILFGIFTLWSMGKDSTDYYYYYFAFKTIVYNVIGIAIALIMLKVDYRSLKKYSKYIYIVVIGICIIGYRISGVTRGAIGWINIGPISFNIYNIAPFFLIIALAGMFSDYDWSNTKNVFKGLALLFIPAIFLIFGGAFAGTVTYTISAITLMIVSGIKIRHLIFTIGTMGGIFIFYVIKQPYRINRLLSFINPEQDSQGAGWIYNKLNEVRYSSGLLGKDEFFKVAQFPDVHTDFIFTYIMYSFGFIACIMLFVLVIGFITRIGFIGVRSKDMYGKLLVIGLCALFASQFLINILMNLTLSPVFAIGMPFISYSGSSAVINIISISIITNVYKWRNTPYTITN